MPRWPRGLHLAAGSLPAYGAHKYAIYRVPVGHYTRRVTGIPLQPGQAQGSIDSSGGLTLQIGPSGLGTTWYPAQLVLSTTTGVFDTSTANVYLGAQALSTLLAGPVYSGNGVVALAVPAMQPGELLIVKWTGGTSGDTAAVNVIGTMDALST